MPKQAHVKRKSGFSVGDIKKESFRYREDTKPVAAPVAHYNIPKGIAGDAEALITTLESITQGASAAFELREKAETKKGKLAAGKGELRPTGFFNQTAAAAYDRFQGIGDTAKTKDQLTTIHNKAVADLQNESNLNTEDYSKFHDNYQKDIDAAINKILEGRPDDYILGLQENIRAHIGALDQKFQNEEMLHLQNQGMKNITNVVDHDMANIINNAYADNEDPVVAQKVVSKAARQLLSQQHHIGDRMFNLTKPQISELFVDVRGQKAALAGHPEDLMFLEEPDKDGYRLIDSPNLREAGLVYLKQAIAKRNSLDGQADRAYNASLKAMEGEILGFLSEVVGTNTKDPEKIELFKKTVTKYSMASRNKFKIAIAPDKVEHYWNTINALESDEAFRQYNSDSVVETDLFIRAANGDDILGEVNTKKPYLTRTSYNKIITKIAAEDKAKRSRAKNGTTPLDDLESSTKKNLEESLIKIKEFGGLESKLDPARTYYRKQRGMYWYHVYLAQRKAMTNRDKPWTAPQIQEIYDAARYTAYQEIPVEQNARGKSLYDPALRPPKWLNVDEVKTEVKPTYTPAFDKLKEKLNK